jgi:hypothetical protein
MASKPDARITNVDYEDVLRAQADTFSLREIQRALQATRAAARQLGQNVNARIVTEVLALNLPSAHLRA